MVDERIIKFLGLSSTYWELLETYIEIRKTLKKEGYTDDSATHVIGSSVDLLRLHHKIQVLMDNLYIDVKDFFDNDDLGSRTKFLNTYVASKLKEIDELIPLNDGDTKRRNKRD
jgi:hypothetical protein